MKKMKVLVCIVLLGILVTGFLPAAEEKAEEPKKPLLPFILNTAPGFGLGSFIMKDSLGGFIGLGGELLGVGLVGGGFVYIITQGIGAALGEIFTLGLADTEVDSGPAEALILSGLLVWTGTKIFEMIRPFVFAAKYNQEAGFAEIEPEVSFRLVADEDSYKAAPVLAVHLR